MNWIFFLGGSLIVMILLGIAVKLALKRRLEDIDGLGSVRKRGDGKKVIAEFGGDDPRSGGGNDARALKQ